MLDAALHICRREVQPTPARVFQTIGPVMADMVDRVAQDDRQRDLRDGGHWRYISQGNLPGQINVQTTHLLPAEKRIGLLAGWTAPPFHDGGDDLSLCLAGFKSRVAEVEKLDQFP